MVYKINMEEIILYQLEVSLPQLNSKTIEIPGMTPTDLTRF